MTHCYQVCLCKRCAYIKESIRDTLYERNTLSNKICVLISDRKP